ncbi:putative quinol monooxygenase [Dyadobacter alkalitolerans]|uniref:putative quinol monooxygenase n=1 Tax=Dyadobacter alkalitolerans TaxID=492736 RepID=UPI000687B65F|nr:antibiotic biosynthesis monooxygenase family protein [Dyadobacter alkalitolerans]
MLVRVVRMTFHASEAVNFLTIFNQAKLQIRTFPGCSHLELLRDLDQPNIFVTYSHWDSSQSLDHYRHSEFFQSTWTAIKVLFADRPIAFSMENVGNAVGESTAVRTISSLLADQ